MKEIIRLDDIRRDFHVGDEVVHALRGVSFTISQGEFVTIMGTSGSGKSTLLNTLGCLDTPTSGEYYLDGVSVRTMNKRQRATLRNRKIGFVFQNYNLLPKTTAVENVELPLMYNPSFNDTERRKRAIDALMAVGLGDRLMHKSNQMSGGQMQRVAIARALVNDPAVILADEAIGNLDTRTSFEILVLFQRLHREGRTIIFVTHNPEIALYSSQPLVPLEKEIAFVTDYIELMRIRLPKNVELKSDISVSSKGETIAPLLFISLVENAFKHGVSNNLHSFIHIKMSMENGHIVCFIENSYSPKRQEQDKSGSGIGLSNLERRLELIYPDRFILKHECEGDIYSSLLSVNLKDVE